VKPPAARPDAATQKSTSLCESEIEQRHVLLQTNGAPKHYFD
jgi:hypothetical protein